MKQQTKGRIHERITAISNVGYPGYIVRGDKKSLMIDAGVNLLAPSYLASIKEIFGGVARLDYLFLTHSHYDHVGAAHYLKRHVPGLKIGGHERLAGLLRKSSVLETMNRLSTSHPELQRYNPGGEDLTMEPLEIDLVLKQGDVFDLGGLTCSVYETPGHTRDSLAFYFPEIGALFPGDATGILEDDEGSSPRVAFVASYQDYLDSLELLITLHPEIICLAHRWVLTHDDAADFLERSLAETFRYREVIESYLDAASGDVERVIRDMAHAEYDVKGGIRQARAPYLANLTAQVNHIAGLRQ
jgi:glyoxylase-like metal-dependent hydrolase (beta-lactamase superfamily II)